eukprot:9097077-Pyramimonas_sp.AAC.1
MLGTLYPLGRGARCLRPWPLQSCFHSGLCSDPATAWRGFPGSGPFVKASAHAHRPAWSCLAPAPLLALGSAPLSLGGGARHVASGSLAVPWCRVCPGV